MKYSIYIPSSGRSSKQITVRNLPKSYLKKTCIVVPKKELKEYEKIDHGVDVIACPSDGIGKTRQWIIENATPRHVLMIDDDMYFYHRIKKGEVGLATNTEADTAAMLDAVFAELKKGEFRHVGVAPRTWASFNLCSYKVCSRINNFHGYDRKLLEKTGVRFDELPLMEDFNVTLSLLLRKFPNKIWIDYVWNQPGSNISGGCSRYRTAELQSKAANMLHKRHPAFVKVVEKKVKERAGSWDGMKSRIDVIVAWHRAYEFANGGPHPHWEEEVKSNRSRGEE